MASTADQPITALRTGHNNLVALVHSLTPAAVAGPSGASEWTIAQVLSHLGSGAEIGLATLGYALGDTGKPAADFNPGVWARWDAMAAQEQAHHFMMANEKLVRRYEALDDKTRSEVKIDLGFLPAPTALEVAASFRLNEFALHAWDVEIASNPDATVAADAVEPMFTVVPFLIGWLGKPGPVLPGQAVDVAVHTTGPERHFGLHIADQVTLTDVPTNPGATLRLPAESWLRLATGRLAAAHTPAEVSAAGGLTLDQLRQTFPGF